MKILPKSSISEISHGNRYKGNKEYLYQLKEEKYTVIPIEEYKGADIEILHKCLLCDYIYLAKPHNILRHKSKCKKCKAIAKHEHFVNRVSSINPNIEILGFYNTTCEKIHVKCKLCGYEWFPYGTSLESPRECQNCGQVTTTISKEEFFRKLNLNTENIKLLTHFTKATDIYKCQCEICGYIWEIKGSALINGKSGCRNCYKLSKELSNEDFLQKLYSQRNDIIPLENYKPRGEKMKFRCLKCNKVFETTANGVLNGKIGCSNCNASHGERNIQFILDKYNIKYIKNMKYKDLLGIKGKCLSYDFYLYDYNKLIEYQGKQHEKPVKHFGGNDKYEIQLEHDNRKREYAKNHNIDLLEIWYYDFNRIEKILIKELKLESVTTTGVA